MKIVFLDLAGADYPGGCEKYFANLVKYFSSKNKITFVHSTQFSRFMEYVYFFLANHKVGTIQFEKRDIGKSQKLNIGSISLIPFTKSNKKFKKILLQADKIYTKNEFQELAILYILLGKKEYSQRVIIGVHSAIFIPDSIKGIWKFLHDLQYDSVFYKHFLRSSLAIHVINSDYKKLLADKYNLKKEKIIYIPYFIDWKTIQSKTKKRKTVTILWAGRLTPQKGVDRLKKIITLLSKLKNFNNLNFFIAGQGQNVIEDMLDQYENIKFLGYVKNMNELYQKVDLAIVTSYFETFGYNVLEPQSYGVPVIAFDIIGPRDIIIDSKTGFLVKKNNEFANKVQSFSNNTVKLLHRKDIFNLINNKFSKKKILDRMNKELFNL